VNTKPNRSGFSLGHFLTCNALSSLVSFCDGGPVFGSIQEFMAKTSTHSHIFGPYTKGMVDMRCFEGTTTACNGAGKQCAEGEDGWKLDSGSHVSPLFWHGGRGGCYGSSHMGMATTNNVHSNSRVEHFGHFHRSGVDQGVYSFGGTSILFQFI
jgi:hypothetical protein